MGVFDWFRRQPAVETAPETGHPDSGSGAAGTLVEERPATECRVPAQESGACPESAPEAAADGAPATLATVPKQTGSGRESEGEHDMGLLDTIKEKLAPHHDKVDQGVDKAADMVDEKTGGKYSGQIDAASEKAKDTLGVPDEQPGEAPPPVPEAGAEGAPPAGEAPPQEQPPA